MSSTFSLLMRPFCAAAAIECRWIRRVDVDSDEPLVADDERGFTQLGQVLADRVDVKVLAGEQELRAVAPPLVLRRD